MDSFSVFSSGTNEIKLKKHCFAVFLAAAFGVIPPLQWPVIGTPHAQSAPPDLQPPEPPSVYSVAVLALRHRGPNLAGATMTMPLWCRTRVGRVPHRRPVQHRISWFPVMLTGESLS